MNKTIKELSTLMGKMQKMANEETPNSFTTTIYTQFRKIRLYMNYSRLVVYLDKSLKDKFLSHETKFSVSVKFSKGLFGKDNLKYVYPETNDSNEQAEFLYQYFRLLYDTPEDFEISHSEIWET